ncbi:hypothetical protein [Burkholderia vietnamiensis]|uniref:hypothetical protein n=1 Tax=Burkholderia vietnamiensis TaxID=60552 RepID=UPI001CF1F082|nr:hypothetical protein [Burkholderia vietnamiensis]MCA8195471.1 hypothetical protein [Burkholderia vietnamiensis]
MSIRTLAARGLSFAHLAGINSRAARAEDDQRDDEDERAEEDEQEEQDRDDGDSNGSKGKKGKKAEDDDPDDKDAEDDELEEDDSGKGKKGKKAADDEDDERADDDDEQMRGKGAVARARLSERARCAAIMGHKAAGRNVALAASLAFNTSMSSQEAIAVLKATPGSSANADRPERAARNPQLGAGGEMHRNSHRESAAGWDRAFSKATGKRA